jgi:hypothetical protein
VSDFLGSFRFELRDPPPPMTFAEITALMAQIEAGKQRIACASDVFEQIRDTIYGAGYGLYFTVIECRWMDDSQVVVMPSEAEYDAEMQALARRMMDGITDKWERDFRAEVALDSDRRRYGAVVYQPGPFSSIITGI